MHRFEALLLMPLPTQNSPQSSCFPQQQKGVEETMICFIKIQSENMKMNLNIRFFMFSMICNFSEICPSYSMVSIYL